MENKSYKLQKIDFLPARRTHVVSGFQVGPCSGRQVVTNCDGGSRHNREGREI